MAIPPQFLKHTKGKAAAEDAKDGGKDDAQEDSNGNLKSAKGAPKKDSKDPKGAPFDTIPNGPMKGKNPNDFKKGGKSNANVKRAALLAQLRGGK